MKNKVKKVVVVVPVSLIVAFISICASYHILVNEVFWPSILFTCFCIYFISLYIVIRISDKFTMRGKLDFEKKTSNIFFHKEENCEIYTINDFLTMKFDLPENSDTYVEKLSDGKIFFSVVDVEKNKVAADIVLRILTDTIHFIKSPDDLQSLMKNLDTSIVLLNIKSQVVSVITGIIDPVEMNMKFINASNFKIISCQRNSADSVQVPLISNKYKMAAEKQLPFIAAQYSLKVDDTVIIMHGEDK